MKQNSRLSLALHTLGHMAGHPDDVQTSADIAAHAGTNPVVVRRVLGRLREAGLLLSERGHAGGWKLARTPEEITLADIYTALDEQLISTPEEIEPGHCAVEHTLHKQVAAILNDIEHSLIKRLQAISLADLRQ